MLWLLEENEKGLNQLVQNNLHFKLFHLLSATNTREHFLFEECLAIMNALLVLASNKNLMFLLKEKILLMEKQSSPKILDAVIQDQSLKYSIIMNAELLFIILKFVLEINSDDNFKILFLNMIDRMTKYSFFNALNISQVNKNFENIIIEYYC